MRTNPTRVLIVGGGTAGWMAAAALARFLGTAASIRLVESDQIGTVGVGEATIPQIQLFNAGLGLDEAEFLRETRGSYKLGIEFHGWGAPQDRYIHAFGSIGRGLGLLPFHHYWLRHRASGGTEPLWAFSACAEAAAGSRYAPRPERPGAAPSGLTHAYHFDAGLYAAYLRRYAEARGVLRTEGEVQSVTRAPESGDVASITLRSGETLAADLFVDCTGFRGLLIEQTLGAGFEDWTHLLPCDRALAVPCAHGSGPFAPVTRATARAAGWQWRIPLQHRIGNGYVYSSAHLSDDEAAATLLANLDGPALADPRPLRFTTGRRRSAFHHNVVALGLAAGFMEPLESTSIHLIQSGVARLLALWPALTAPSAREEFNRQTRAEWESIRDFLVLHYWANGRSEPFWAERRATALPESLAHKLALFRESALLVRHGDELFTEVGWLQVLLGQRIEPAVWHPLADSVDPRDLAEFLRLCCAHVAAVTRDLPDHGAHLRALAATQPKAA